MRAKEFVIESNLGSTVPTSDTTLSISNADALPAVYSIPELVNSDFYKQYRFGVAIAMARGAKATMNEPKTNMAPASAWGENQIVVGYDLDPDIIDQALHTIGLKSSDKKLISTRKSEESKDVDTISPIQGFKGYQR
jgi:hypothetical protein